MLHFNFCQMVHSISSAGLTSLRNARASGNWGGVSCSKSYSEPARLIPSLFIGCFTEDWWDGGYWWIVDWFLVDWWRVQKNHMVIWCMGWREWWCFSSPWIWWIGAWKCGGTWSWHGRRWNGQWRCWSQGRPGTGPAQDLPVKEVL